MTARPVLYAAMRAGYYSSCFRPQKGQKAESSGTSLWQKLHCLICIPLDNELTRMVCKPAGIAPHLESGLPTFAVYD